MPALLARIRGGDREAKKDAVLGYVHLAMHIVGKYITVTKATWLTNEFVSAAMEGIVEAVEKVADGTMTHDALAGYVTEYVHRFISAELNRRQVVRVPRTTIQSRRYSGQEAPPKPNRVEFDDPDIRRKMSPVSVELDFEIKEILERAIQNETERSIITLRSQGRTDQEIAAEIDLSKTSVFVIRKAVETRFLEIFYGD